MKNTKIFSAFAACALSALAISPALAAGEYLPDVENVAAVIVDEGVQIMWDAVAGADQYTLYFGTESISTDGASYENSIVLGDVTEYIVTDLAPETEYFFAIAADDSTGTYLGSFNYSEEISATTPVAEIPVDPATIDPEPVVDPLAEVSDPEPEQDPVDDPDPVDELVGGELYPSGTPESETTPEKLPKSGPATAVAFLLSGGGAYFWRKFKK